MRVSTNTRLFIAAAMALSVPLAAAAALPEPAGKPSATANELIVLLDQGGIVPTPESVVDAVSRKQAVPDALGVGNPSAARFMIAERASEKAQERLLDNPESPEALLQRYIVLSYPSVVDLDKIIAALEMNPNVLWVGRNGLAELAVEPNDSFFDDNPGGIPRPADQYQWGSYSLHLPEAWDNVKGHSYVGVVDTGLDTDHPDLRPFNASGSYIGGNFRAHLSYDYGYDDDNVDEGQTQGSQTVSLAGHGTHVSGIIGATANNTVGVAGACWNCSLMISKVSTIHPSNGANTATAKADIVEGINGAIGRGAQVLNLSLGYEPGDPNRPDCATTPLDPFCVALQLLEDRDTVMTAAAGNNGTSTADWPSVDSRVIGVGGIKSDGSFWNDCPGFECGSNADVNQIVTPAKQIISTFYEGLPYSPSFGCSDSVDGTLDGYGLCTGTSMASPYAAGVVGILRSVNPLLTKANIRSILTTNLENPVGWNSANGIGKPQVSNAVKAALGKVNNQVLLNRLTPLFQLYSSVAEDYVYTTFPQMATGFQWSPDDYDSPLSAPQVPGYGPYFPGGKTCVVGPCDEYARASVYIFATDRSPNGSPLVPLYRMSYEGTFPGGPSNPNNADHTYTTETAGINAFAGVGYHLDGIEGYIYQRCTPEPSCIPAGAVRLYRYYNATLDDWAIFPESELSTWVANGYSQQSGTNPWIGYVYPNVDTDGDWLIDGFEGLIGTDPNVSDTDCDGKSDGSEILLYPYNDPKVGNCTPR